MYKKIIVLVVLLMLSSEVYAFECRVYFSPLGGCEQAIVSELSKAQKEIIVQAYVLTSMPIIKMLGYKSKFIKEIVILDKKQSLTKFSKVSLLNDLGVTVFTDGKHAIAHNKVIIIDGETVITGSFNFTGSAESRNAENLLIIKDKGIAELYRLNWVKHVSHSVRFPLLEK